MSRSVDSYRLLIADVYELAGVSRHTAGELAATQGQTVARWHLLSVISAEALSVAAAARRLGLARQSVQRVANDLRADALLVVRPDPKDRRAPLLHITATGRRVLGRLQSASELDRSQMLAGSGVDPADLDVARRTLRALVQALRPREPESPQ